MRSTGLARIFPNRSTELSEESAKLVKRNQRISMCSKFSTIGLLVLCGQCYAQSAKLVLRDLTILNETKIEFDQDKVSLASGRTLGWDQIHSGQIGDARQSEFDKNLKQIGIPLFRVRHRLTNKDWQSLPELVEPLYKRLRSQLVTKSNARTRFIVSLATFYSRLESDNRPAAVVPFVESCRIRQSFPEVAADLNSVGTAFAELDDFFKSELIPVWFNEANAKAALNDFKRTFSNNTVKPKAGELIYLASLQIVAREFDDVEQTLRDLANAPSKIGKQWMPVLRAQLEIAAGQQGTATNELRKSYRSLTGSTRAAANFLLALDVTHKDDYDAAILDLLYVPAVLGRKNKTLSAAALYEAASIADKVGNSGEAEVFRRELLNHYPNTYHGQLQKNR